MGKQGQDPIFVVGMARSGTSLLSSVLSRHSRIAVAPETHFLDVWMQSYGHREPSQSLRSFQTAFCSDANFRQMGISWDLVQDHLSRFEVISWRNVFASIIDAYASSLNKPVPGEKTPAHYRYCGLLFRWFPTARIVFTLRDPRAVAASLSHVPWSHGVAHLHAREWRQALRSYENLREDPRVTLVQYERLVSQPVEACRELCHFLKMDFEPGMVEATGSSDSQQASEADWLSQHWRTAVGAINTHSLSRWPNELDAYSIAIIEHLLRRQMKTYGYPANSQRFKLRHRVRYNQEVCRTNIRRLWRLVSSPRKLFSQKLYRAKTWQ